MSHLLITPRAIEWLQTTKAFTILHRFDQVVNLLNENRMLLSLSTKQIHMTPFSLQVTSAELNQWRGFPPGKELYIKENQRLGLKNGKKRWHPTPDWSRLPERLPDGRSLTYCDHALASMASRLTSALATREREPAIEFVQFMIGRGPGLTPLGDDILIGIFLAIYAKRPMLAPFVKELILTGELPLTTKTTTLSAALLSAAASGEAAAPWHALANGQVDAVDKICAIGATSGVGAWFGFTSMINSLESVSE